MSIGEDPWTAGDYSTPPFEPLIDEPAAPQMVRPVWEDEQLVGWLYADGRYLPPSDPGPDVAHRAERERKRAIRAARVAEDTQIEAAREKVQRADQAAVGAILEQLRIEGVPNPDVRVVAGRL